MVGTHLGTLLVEKSIIFSYRRDDSHCKICKEDDGDDWIGCDACGQFFHASCLKLDYGEALQDMFYCT